MKLANQKAFILVLNDYFQKKYLEFYMLMNSE
jgi:hypothetical protein